MTWSVAIGPQLLSLLFRLTTDACFAAAPGRGLQGISSFQVARICLESSIWTISLC